MDSANLQPDTGTVIVTVAALEAVTGMGKVTHLAIIDLDVGGVAWQLQGVRVVKQSGGLAVQPPQWRHPKSGVYIPAVALPAELAKAIGGGDLGGVATGRFIASSVCPLRFQAAAPARTCHGQLAPA